MLAVSYCNRDIYSGTGQTDPNNPNKNTDGSARTTNGLQATKAAIAFTESTYPTSKYFLAGGSAGSAGAYYVGWSEQLSGLWEHSDAVPATRRFCRHHGGHRLRPSAVGGGHHGGGPLKTSHFAFSCRALPVVRFTS